MQIATSSGGFAGTLLNGGDLGQAFKAGVIGGVVGGASGFLAFAAGGISGNSIGAILERMGRHAFANAWLSGIRGQNMFSGMLTGAASSLDGAGLMSLKIENVGLLTVGNAVVGGTVSVIGGGKFANGAVTGAFTMLFNELMHPGDEESSTKGNKLITQYEKNKTLAFGYQAAGEILLEVGGGASASFAREYVEIVYGDVLDGSNQLLEVQGMVVDIISSTASVAGVSSSYVFGGTGVICYLRAGVLNSYNAQILAPQIKVLDPYYYKTHIDYNYKIGGEYGGAGAREKF